jgi:hypothetical protein
MAQVKIEAIIGHLDSEMRSAVHAALLEVAPDLNIDPHQLFRAFKRAVGRKCSTWETVPDDYVQSQ